ncbi:MAG: ABC transporter ATP-binding protein/permease [Gemmatimonadota bacterium]|nr:ABC transporter ATP-binding protein/permease [Gemmatimonadota bacterium]
MPGLRALGPLLPYFRPYRGRVALGLLAVVIAAALGGVIPWLLRGAIDGVRAGRPLSQAWLTGGAILAVALASGVARYGMREMLNGVSRWIEYDLRNDLFGHLETLDASYFAQMRTGDLMARMTNDLSAVRMAAGPAYMYLTNTVFGGIFALVFMLGISVRLTVLALLPMILLPLLMVRVGTELHRRFEAVQEHFSTLTTRVQENISGVRVVRAYRQEQAEIDRFAGLSEEYARRNIRLVKLWGLMNPGFGLLAGLAAAIVLGYGGVLALRGEMSIGSLVAFGLYLAMLTWPMIALGWVINLFQRAAASMARLNEIFDARPAVQSPPSPRTLPPATAGRAIEFRHVGFHYAVRDGDHPRWVLRNVSFRVAAGGTLGVVGATGSGKSALIDLIPRLHDPQEGEILIDGVPIRELSLAALRTEIGAVPQESFLFSDTIAANLAYGSDDERDGTWASRVAQLDDTIAGFPGGYDTMLGERGINLSGGQKQRLALARALARRPHIVLLDDALSAVDAHTEAEILRGLREALGGRTAVIASHRISAIRDATWIVVLDEGRIVEQGRHEGLLAAGGRYWALLNRQLLVESIETDEELASIHGAE